MSVPSRLYGEERFIKLEPNKKAPATDEGQKPDGPFYRAGDRQLRNWIEFGGNVGLNLGPLVCLDVDDPAFRKLATNHFPGTFSVRSGGGGEHRYYRCDWDGNRAFSSDGEEIGSVRTGNWYVVIPPSTHPSGDRYKVLEDREVCRIPKTQLVDFLEEATEQFGGTASTGGGGAAAARPVLAVLLLSHHYQNSTQTRRQAHKPADGGYNQTV